MKSSTARLHVLFPVGEEPFQECKLPWFGRAQVRFLTDVFGQVEEPLLRFPLGLPYVFQVSLAYGPPSSLTVVCLAKKGSVQNQACELSSG